MPTLRPVRVVLVLAVLLIAGLTQEIKELRGVRPD